MYVCFCAGAVAAGRYGPAARTARLRCSRSMDREFESLNLLSAGLFKSQCCFLVQKVKQVSFIQQFLEMVIRFLAEGAASGLNVIAVYVTEILRVTGFDGRFQGALCSLLCVQMLHGAQCVAVCVSQASTETERGAAKLIRASENMQTCLSLR